jgi:two-component system response regulator PilR (NtrC family)
MSQPQVLIVDDEPDIRELLEMTLRRMELDTRSAESLRQAHALLHAHRFNLCLTDMRLPDGNGIDLVRHIQATYPEVPVAVITAHGNMQSAIEALKAGAFDFLSKPIELQVLRDLVNNTLKLAATPAPRERRSRDVLLGDSKAMRAIRGMIAKLSRSQAPVYISGESGTGKELVARLIHQLGPRADKPFIPVNCGAIPAELMESEFFGHRKGSFTGAVADKEGLFQAAHGGTLFLDEVADLPLNMQVKLLRAIQEKAVRPVGAQQEVPSDVRILSATHKDLADLAEHGEFRQDLYYRINVIELRVPSLRERREDIPLLATHVLKRLAAQSGRPPPTLAGDALDALSDYAFPGNVRELENILERALTLSDGDSVAATDLTLPNRAGNAAAPDAAGRRIGEGLDEYLARVERDAILEALEATDRNKTAAARRLGITFRALRHKLKKLGLD